MTNDDIEVPDLPKGWEWQGGNRGGSHYTAYFGTEYRMGGSLAGKHGLGGYSGEVYWDKNGDGKHHVSIDPITRITETGDPEHGYPVRTSVCDTEQEALNRAVELVESLSTGEY